MTKMAMSALLAMLATALPVSGQDLQQPAKDLSVHSVQAPGLEVRFVDYHWQPALFEAMEKGTGEIPEARRNWVVARLILDQRPLTIEGAGRLGVGNYVLALWPNLDGKGLAVEVRSVDMRDSYLDLNAMAPAPRGMTLYKAPARFEPLSPLAPRLDVSAITSEGAVVLTVSYGDRRLSLKLTP
jgi:hypothetical protein